MDAVLSIAYLWLNTSSKLEDYYHRHHHQLLHSASTTPAYRDTFKSDMELGQWVTGSMGHFGHLSRPGHRVTILIRRETRVFPVFEKMPKMQNVHLKCWNDKSHCQVSVVGLKSLDVSPCNKLLLLPMIIKHSLAWEYFFTHKSTFGVHYRKGSPGQLGLWIAGFLGHWVSGSQNVIQFHLWFK